MGGFQFCNYSSSPLGDLQLRPKHIVVWNCLVSLPCAAGPGLLCSLATSLTSRQLKSLPFVAPCLGILNATINVADNPVLLTVTVCASSMHRDDLGGSMAEIERCRGHCLPGNINGHASSHRLPSKRRQSYHMMGFHSHSSTMPATSLTSFRKSNYPSPGDFPIDGYCSDPQHCTWHTRNTCQWPSKTESVYATLLYHKNSTRRNSE